jgi:AcrR family transcriptional regulator
LIRELFKEVSAQTSRLEWDNFDDLPFRERFLAAFSQLLRYFLSNPKEFIFGEQYYFSPFFNPESAAGEGTQKLRDLLVQAREEQAIRDVPLVVLESLAYGPIVALAKEHASRGIPVDEEMIGQVIQACWDGLKK